jgi:hypothetical protein
MTAKTLFMLSISLASRRDVFVRPRLAAIARTHKIGVKPRHREEKRWIIRWLALATRIVNFHGRNGDRSMTYGVHGTIATGGISARATARACIQPRPSLGSSHALLLLSGP